MGSVEHLVWIPQSDFCGLRLYKKERTLSQDVSVPQNGSDSPASFSV